MDQELKAIYYDPKNPAGFASIAKLAKASGYSKTEVKKWLKAQPTYTLHRQARKRYPTRKYIVHDIDEQWQADLADVALIAQQNDGYRFILTVIDIFSRYAWARPSKANVVMRWPMRLKTSLKKGVFQNAFKQIKVKNLKIVMYLLYFMNTI